MDSDQEREEEEEVPDRLPDTGLLIPTRGPPRVVPIKDGKGQFSAQVGLGIPAAAEVDHMALTAVVDGERFPLAIFGEVDPMAPFGPLNPLAGRLVRHLRPENRDRITGDVLLVDDNHPLTLEQLGAFFRPSAVVPQPTMAQVYAAMGEPLPAGLSPHDSCVVS